MTFDFTGKANVEFRMEDCDEKMINEFAIKIINSNTYLTPAENNIFEKGNRNILGKQETK